MMQYETIRRFDVNNINNSNELKNIAYAMAEAYNDDKNETMGDCCHAVASKFPDVNDHTFKAMWFAIYAYNDLD